MEKEVKETKKKTTKKTVKKKEVVKEVVQVKRRKTYRELRKLLNKDIEVLIMNNTQGQFYYHCPKTNMEIHLHEFGDTQVVTLELLEVMKRRAKKLLRNYLIMIIDVFPDYDVEDEIEVLDVIRYLDIEDLYEAICVDDEFENDGTIYDEEFFDNLIINKDKSTFDEVIKKMNAKLLTQMAHRCVYLYRTGKFDSRYKMETVEKLLGIEDLFTYLEPIK